MSKHTPSDVAVLYARQDSIYKTIPGCDVFDIDRDARTFQGGIPIVAHPPCRAWGSLRGLAKPAPGEKELARSAVHLIRTWGGVLEHPRLSRLWPDMGLPMSGKRDAFGGFSIGIDQFFWGHRAQKRTLLYVVGCEPRDIPEFPLALGDAPRVVTNRKGLRAGMPGFRTELTKAEREHTPPLLAEWLVELARRCSAQQIRSQAV